jgi:hypothetical protein
MVGYCFASVGVTQRSANVSRAEQRQFGITRCADVPESRIVENLNVVHITLI